MVSLFASTEEHLFYALELTEQERIDIERELDAEWGGELAKAFGLTGRPTLKEALNLTQGLSPDGKRQLLSSSARIRVIDHVCSGPKVTSVLWALANPEWKKEIEACLKTASRRVLQKIERELVKVRRGHGGKIKESCKVVFLSVTHFTNRSGEPHLHIHSLLFLIGERSDGTYQAVYTRKIFGAKRELGRLLRNEFARELEARGLQVSRLKESFHLPPIPIELCNAFSTRRKEIKEYLADRGYRPGRASKFASLSTRSEKIIKPDLERLLPAWHEKALALGFGPRDAEILLKQARERCKSHSKEKDADLEKSGKKISVVPGRVVREFIWRRNTKDDPRQIGPAPGRVIFTIPGTRFELRVVRDALSWKAPGWSPFKHWKLSKLVIARSGVRLDAKAPRFSNPLWKRQFALGTISTHRMKLFPFAPEWSPLRNLHAPVVAVNLNKWGVLGNTLSKETQKRPSFEQLDALRRDREAKSKDSEKEKDTSREKGR